MKNAKMTKYTVILIYCFTLFFNHAIGQTFKQQFNELMNKKDTFEQYKILKKWETVNSNDPELYVAYFNYYIEKSIKDVMIYNKAYADSNHILKDPFKELNYIQLYDETELEKGFLAIEKGINKFPTRLDMRLGKIYMYGERQNFKNFTDEIIKVIDYSVEIDNKWLWTDNKPADDIAMGEAIQKYFVELYSFYLSNEEETELIGYMEKIPLAVLRNYPDRVVSLSNLSIVYLLKNEFDKALEVLLKAEKLEPTDHVILLNIAQTYEQKENYKQAIKYYNLTMKYGDEEEKEFAKKKVKDLKKK